jgi:hypothetical protein
MCDALCFMTLIRHRVDGQIPSRSTPHLRLRGDTAALCWDRRLALATAARWRYQGAVLYSNCCTVNSRVTQWAVTQTRKWSGPRLG